MRLGHLSIAIAISSILWLGAIISAVPAEEKIHPLFERIAFGKPDSKRLSYEELKPKVDRETYLTKTFIVSYVWVLPALPLVLIPWTRLRWRVLGIIPILEIAFLP
jgi:hypothetical protein